MANVTSPQEKTHFLSRCDFWTHVALVKRGLVKLRTTTTPQMNRNSCRDPLDLNRALQQELHPLADVLTRPQHCSESSGSEMEKCPLPECWRQPQGKWTVSYCPRWTHYPSNESPPHAHILFYRHTLFAVSLMSTSNKRLVRKEQQHRWEESFYPDTLLSWLRMVGIFSTRLIAVCSLWIPQPRTTSDACKRKQLKTLWDFKILWGPVSLSLCKSTKLKFEGVFFTECFATTL